MTEYDYYPYGLTMAGISDEALKENYPTNKYRFQKQELQNKEFSDGSGLEWYEFKYRFDDPQIGRFWSVDPLANKYVYNSPYAFSEDKVTSHVELEGLEATPLASLWGAVKNEAVAFGKQIDNMVNVKTSDEHTTSDTKVAPQVDVKTSVETTTTDKLNFGMEDFMQHLTNTNSSDGGPPLKVEVNSSTDVADKTTTTTKVGDLTFTGTTTVSRTDGTSQRGVTVTGPVSLGSLPNATVGFGISTDNNGLSTFSLTVTTSTTVGKSTYTGGAEVTISGNNNGSRNASGSFSISGQSSSGNDTKKYSLNINF
jgi:RHS repeat-associated protein